jgi:sulfur-carrier protein adenylyltransferase/sulfurtransferase
LGIMSRLTKSQPPIGHRPAASLTNEEILLDSSQEIVAHCRSGRRSAQAVEFLWKAGFRKVLNLRGGMLSWSTEVDPTLPWY